MAEIFRATSKGLGGFEKTLAIKRLHREYSLDEQFVRMIVDEAQISVQLQHPNIVQVFDLGKVEEMYYISMEFVEGPDLFRLLQVLHDTTQKIPIQAACYLLIEVCNGLHYAHFRKKPDDKTPLQIVHRDVSPQNILLSWDGEIKIADFGIAKAAERLTHTQTGVIKGKFYYMSPEQAIGADLDHRSDIFSAGILLFELLTATPLYEDPGDESVINLVRRAAVRSPRSERPEILPALESIVMCALQKDRDNRFSTAQHMARALHEFVSEQYGVYTRTDFSGYLRDLFRNTPGYSEEAGKAPILTPPKNGVTLEKFHLTQSQELPPLAPDANNEETADQPVLDAPSTEPKTNPDNIATADLPKPKDTKKRSISVEQIPTKPDGHEPPVIVTMDEFIPDTAAVSNSDAAMHLAMVRRLPPLAPSALSSSRSYTKRREIVLKIALAVVGLAILGVSIAILNVVMTWDTPTDEVVQSVHNKTHIPRPTATLSPTIQTKLKPKVAERTSTTNVAPRAKDPVQSPIMASAQLRIRIERPPNRYKTYVDGELVEPKEDGSFAVTAGRHVVGLKLLPEGTQTTEQTIDVSPQANIVLEFKN